MPELEMLIHQARAIGLETGRIAAGWYFDGNTSKETYRRVLSGIEEGDPEVTETFNVPNFSGEYSDSYTEDDLLHELGCRADMPTEEVDEIVNACLDAMVEGYGMELERVCHYQLEG